MKLRDSRQPFMEKDPVPCTFQGLRNLPGPVLGQEAWLLPALGPRLLGGPAGGSFLFHFPSAVVHLS